MPILAIYSCPFLRADVELTDERAGHIAGEHPDLYPEFEACISETLLDPDLVLTSHKDPIAILFVRWYAEMYSGKYLQVAVVCHPERKWIITAHLLGETRGQTLWQRDQA